MDTSEKNPFGTSSRSVPCGSPRRPAFGHLSTSSTFGSSVPTFGSSVTPTFESSVAPAFGASGDLSLSFGSALSNSVPIGNAFSFGHTSSFPSSGSDFSAFGTLSLSFGPSSTSCQSNTTTFGAPSGSASNPAFGACGTLTLTFGHTPGQSNFVQHPSFSGTTAASGHAFSASGTLSLDFGSTPNLRQSDSTSQTSIFKAKTDNDAIQKSPFEVQHRGSRVANYKRTADPDSGHNLVSISAMPIYKYTSHEELRFGDYKLGDKGDNVPKNNVFSPFLDAKVSPSPFGATHIGTKDGCGSYQIGDRQVTFGVPPSANCFATEKYLPFPLFGQSTSPFGASTIPSFGAKDDTSQIAGSSWTFGGPSAQSPFSASVFGRPTVFAQTASSQISGGLSSFGVPKSELLSSTNPFGSQSTSNTQTVTKESEKQSSQTEMKDGEKLNPEGLAIKSESPWTIYLT